MKKDIYKKGLLLLCVLIIVIITFVGYRLSKKEGHIKAINEKQSIVLDKDKTAKDKDNKKVNKSNTNLVVEISGEVKNPGVYDMPDGSRINDLLEKAGGFTQNADLEYVSANINKAKKLSDEEKIYIPNKQDSANANKENTSVKVTNNKQQSTNQNVSSKININTATKEELMTLKGIGESYAERIIDYRNEHLFENIEELMNVKGIGKKRYESIKDYITI